MGGIQAKKEGLGAWRDERSVNRGGVERFLSKRYPTFSGKFDSKNADGETWKLVQYFTKFTEMTGCLKLAC